MHSDRQFYALISPRPGECIDTLENLKGKKSLSYNAGTSNETTEHALVALILQVQEFVENCSLDSRFAVKLVKRSKKESDAISAKCNSTKPGQKDLNKAFVTVDAALRAHDAALLVTANVALREIDDSARTKKSQRLATEE